MLETMCRLSLSLEYLVSNSRSALDLLLSSVHPCHLLIAQHPFSCSLKSADNGEYNMCFYACTQATSWLMDCGLRGRSVSLKSLRSGSVFKQVLHVLTFNLKINMTSPCCQSRTFCLLKPPPGQK